MAERKYFQDSIIALPEQPGVTRDGLMVGLAPPLPLGQPMTLLFALDRPPERQAELESKVARGEVVSPQDLMERYGAPKAEVAKLESWLRDEGFDILEVTPDGTGIYAQADVPRIEDSLQVTMVPVTKEGITYMAAQDAPSLPAEVGQQVHAIDGLQPFRHANKHLLMAAPAQTGTVTAGGPVATSNVPPYVPGEILAAYGAAGLPFTGVGQTIAILIDTFPADSDLVTFWRNCGLDIGLGQIAKINVSTVPLPAPQGEETLDASWTSGIAPDARIRIYASGSLAFTDLNRALDRIIADLPSQPGMRQLSISLGLGETYLPLGVSYIQHLKFLTLAAAGVNVFVSTGDAGSNPDLSGKHPTGPLQAEYEATDSSVVAVGGTSLRLNAQAQVTSETGWVGSGGGRSVIFSRPAWQVAAGVPSGTDRLVPDVCAAADPNTGAMVVFQGQTIMMGGTSWSAPVWAGLCALMNDAATRSGKPALGYLNPSLYPLSGSQAFRDIVTGSNGAYTAGPGYDLVTGIGAPLLGNLIGALIGPCVLWSSGDLGEGSGAVAWLSGDVNGDGQTEVVQLWSNGGQLGAIVYGWFGSALRELWSSSAMGEGATALQWLIGDVDGDGQDEVVQLWDNGGQLGMMVYAWRDASLVELWSTSNIGQGSGAVSWQICDINGDGKAEVIQLWDNGGSLAAIVYGWTGSAMTTISSSGDLGEGPDAMIWLIGDINAGGKPELIQLWDNGGQLGMIVYGWRNAGLAELWSIPDIGQGANAVSWQIGDVNGDGKAEVIQLWSNGGSLAMIVYGWNGSAMTTIWSSGDMGQGANAVSWQIGDVNGDGKAEVIQLWNNGSLGLIEYGWVNGAMSVLTATGNVGEGPGAEAWAVGPFLADNGAQLLQLWSNGGQLGAILYGCFK